MIEKIELALVIVTYNRLEKLKKALQCYKEQTQGFRNLIVVDNCSTDGTKEYLDEWEHHETTFRKIVIHSSENVGGAGGFYLGQKKALELNADWVFIADDDAYAAPDMVEKFYRFTANHDCSKLSAICATVRNMDGSIAAYHRDRYKIENGTNWFYKEFKRVHIPDEEYGREFFSIDLLSYVGSFLNAKALKKCGLVNPSYFIFFDDSEHSLRLKKYGEIIVIPQMEIVHEGGAAEAKKGSISWRSYYEIRNNTHMLLKHHPRTVIKQVIEEFHRVLGRKIHKTPTSTIDILMETAVMDAAFGRLGMHRKYRPGWKGQEDNATAR